MKAILAFGLLAALLTPGSKADPETVEGLLKKRSNTWQVPIVAKQPNENKPTQVVGGYPQLAPDTLSRPLNPKQGKYKNLLTRLGTYCTLISLTLPRTNKIV